jgi:hypothetical protein
LGEGSLEGAKVGVGKGTGARLAVYRVVLRGVVVSVMCSRCMCKVQYHSTK